MVDTQQNLKGQTAIITGASAGIGKETALLLAREGVNVVLAARREERIKSLVRQINQAEGLGKALGVVTDISHENQIVRLSEAVKKRFGQAEILINNAGHGYSSPITEIDAEAFDRIMNVNLRGAVLCTKHFLVPMKERRYGTIVNVASLSSKRGYANGTPYVASKFALRGFSECLWAEVHSFNIRVFNLYPDFVASEFFDAMDYAFPYLDQVMKPEVIADVIVSALKLPQHTNITELDIRPTYVER